MSDLRDRILNAVKAGAAEVTIPPGIYRGGPAPGETEVLSIGNAHNLRIVAEGVLMVCTHRTRAIEIHDCSNLTLRGLTVDYDPLTFTQGKIIAVASDKSSIDVLLDDGYPRAAYSRIDIVDPQTHYRKHGMPFLWGTKAALVAPNVVRVTLTGIGDAAQVGDLASLNDGNEPGGECHGVGIDNCGGGIQLRDFTLRCAPGMGIVEWKGAGGTILHGIHIVPGPPPPGATAPRLLTTSWDGILHSEVGHGPIFEDSEVEDCGDDTWSVQSGPGLVVLADGIHIAVAGAPDLAVGDHLRVGLNQGVAQVVVVNTVPLEQAGLDPVVVNNLNTAKPWTPWSVGHKDIQLVTLAAPSPFALGTWVYTPEHQGNGFIYRRNHIHSSGRGALVKAGDGVIEDNVFDDCHKAVVINPEAASTGIANVVIRNNQITGADYFCHMPWGSQAGAISVGEATKVGVTPASDRRFGNITITGNTFRKVNGVNIFLGGVSNVTVADNHFGDVHPVEPTNTGADYGIDQSSVVGIYNCDGVTLRGNTLDKLGPFTKKVVTVDPVSTQISGATTGVQVGAAPVVVASAK